jgi:hypothetical protein
MSTELFLIGPQEHVPEIKLTNGTLTTFTVYQPKVLINIFYVH